MMGAKQDENENENKTRFVFSSYTESPLAYTKMSCYLPWIAEQFGLSYEEQSTDDEACVKGSGQKPPFNSTLQYWQYDAVCRNTKGTELNPIIAKEHPCIFPFYYKDKRYDSCGLLEASNFIVPVWRCPTRNITTKYKDTDINHFKDDLDLRSGHCYDIEFANATCNWDLEDGGPGCKRQLDPDLECPSHLVLPPFSTCKSDIALEVNACCQTQK